MSENLTQQLPDDLLRQILASINSPGERMTGLGQRMTALEERVDRRLQETRPIWEAVPARLDKIEGRMTALGKRTDGLESRMGGLETRMDNLELDTRAGFRRVENLVAGVSMEMLEAPARQRDIEKRMDRVESEPEP